MKKLFNIVKDNAKALRAKSIRIEEPIAEEYKELAFQMRDYLKLSQDKEMREKHKLREGVGLAAPQIGKNIRLIVVYYPLENEDGSVSYVEHLLINPEIISESVKMVALAGGEGCLSVDDVHEGRVHRHYKVLIKAYDVLLGKTRVITARGYEAIVLQHEYDHLEGILYYDHIDKNNPDKTLPNEVIL